MQKYGKDKHDTCTVLCALNSIYLRIAACSYNVLLRFKTHSSVSAAKKTKKDMRHTSILFTGTINLLNSTSCISKLPSRFLPNLYIFCLTYTLLHISKLKEIALALLEIFVPKNCPIFFTFFSFAQNYIKMGG